jgi:uncharacterized protein (TIGR00369 family)
MTASAESSSATPDAFLAMGRGVIASQPFSVLVGAELHALSRGAIDLQVPVAEKLKQQDGFVHGGVLSYLAENALAFAGGTALAVPIVVAEFKIDYLRPALGERLIARGKAVHVGSSQAVCACEIFVVQDGEEKLCALAQGTIARKPDAS